MFKPGEYTHLSAAEVEDLLESDPKPLIIDVRDDWEFQRYRIPDAVNLPLDELASSVDEIDGERDIITVCEHGMRSETAAEYLVSTGFERVATMDGGMAAYEGTVIRGQ